MTNDPWLRALLEGAAVVTALMTAVAWITWLERKIAGRIQSRLGPTMVGPFGLLQPLADAVKSMQKESIVPRDADALLFWLAPPLTLALALGTAAVIPFSPGLLASDVDIGVLYALALSGLLSFPIWIAGWASNNKYSLLGGMRMVAQGISYEIPMVLSALVPVVLAGTLSMGGVVRHQAEHGWFVVSAPGVGFVAFLVFLLTALAEGNRIPFDIPEAESELVAGPTTEYTAIQWSLFAAAEYAHSLLASAIAATLFLGGWDGPVLPPAVWMVLKTGALFLLITWLRWSLLRLRSDQLMSLCWKLLVPLTLLLLLGAGTWVTLAT
ncbi:MAG: NADH-quinone oxidoreductase subunit NuoH [Polyangiaceae bacterium]|nr:NADH-quinone oxidoreductase subunit NuoH [Polyangiaceae bacterium]